MLINAAIFFGHYVIISAALNLQFGNTGIPNMSSNVSVAIGSFSVSSIVIRVSMWVSGCVSRFVFVSIGRMLQESMGSSSTFSEHTYSRT